MARPKIKESKAVNLKLDVSVVEQLEEYCNETGLSKTVAIERILSKFFSSAVEEWKDKDFNNKDKELKSIQK